MIFLNETTSIGKTNVFKRPKMDISLSLGSSRPFGLLDPSADFVLLALRDTQYRMIFKTLPRSQQCLINGSVPLALSLKFLQKFLH